MRKYILMFFTGLIGGVCGALLISSTDVVARGSKGDFSEVSVYNQKSNRVAYIVPGRVGQGTMWFYDANGDYRLQLGTYESGKEIGQPLIGLHDNQKHLRTLLRLYGDTDSPALVMKDQTGYDRLVIGLRAGSEEPYIEYTTNSGKRINLLK